MVISVMLSIFLHQNHCFPIDQSLQCELASLEISELNGIFSVKYRNKNEN
jgi:hypothetical protein